MQKLLFFLTALLFVVSCSDDIVTGNDIAVGEGQEQVEPAMRTIRISAAPSESRANRTSLNGENFNIVWDEGDEFQIVKEGAVGTSNMLRITLDSNGSGIGYTVSGALVSSEINVKYDDVKVVIGGEDVTSKICSDNTDDNAYKIGITNNKENYQYAPAGNEMKAKLYGSGNNKTFMLARSTSSNGILSESNKAEITLTNIQYKFNIGSWHSLNESSALTNGSSINGVSIGDAKSFEWLHGINSTMHLTSEAGNTHGEFEGQIPASTSIDGATLAVYPTSAYKKYVGGTLSLALSNVQDYVEGSFDHKANVALGNITEAEGDSYHVAFKNMCGVLQLNLKGQGEVGSISITDKGGKMLWGYATVEAADYQDGINTEMLTGGDNIITLNCDGVTLTDEEKTFHIVVPVGAFENGMDIEVKSKDGTQLYKKSTTSNNMIKRGIVKQMPVLNVEMLEAYDLENEAVKLYFSYPHYQTYGEKSHFTTYASALKNMYSHDTPNSVPLSWTGDASNTYTVSLTYKNDDDVSTTKTYTATGTSFDAYNLVPGKKYSYTVKAGETVVKSGRFYTTGQVRMGRIDDSWNCRDLGGWTGLNGKKIKYEWIFRCSSLNGVFYKKPSSTRYKVPECANPANYTFTETSRQQVLDLGFKSELDLRTTRAEENNDNADDLSHAWSLAQNNTGIEDWNFFHIKTNGASAPMSNYAVIKDVAWIINEVINKKRPVAFHCRSGADRTGMVAIALESLLGVAPGDLARDYELTNFSSEQPKAEGKNELRDRKVTDTSKECYKFHKALFQDDKTNPGANYQEKMYYYLNQTFRSLGVAINASDLDKFIKFMLGLDSYTHPSWATENGNSLESIYNHQ